MNIRSRLIGGLFTALVIAIMSGCGQEAQEPAVIELAVVTDSVQSEDGVTIYYDVHGDADRTIVLIHCWSGDRTYWDGQIDALTPYYRVVTVDLGGHGQSGLGRDSWTMEAFGADVAAVINKLGTSEMILVGHSMGGPVAIETARRLTDTVTAIIGIDNFQSFASNLTQEQVDGFVANFMPDFQGATTHFVRAMYPDGYSDTALVEKTARDMAAAPPEVAISAIGHTLGYNYREALAEMPSPIRTISSDRYPTDIATNQQVAASFEVKVIPGCGHFPQFEDPANFNQLLLETIAEFWPEAVPAQTATE